jgi:hypothetical protein
MRRLALVASLLAAHGVAAAGPLAGEPNPTRPAPSPEALREAARLFEEARTLWSDERFDEACERYRQSFELERAVGTQLNVANCEERDGHPGRAWALFDEVARLAERSGGAKRAAYARQRADALVPRLATIVVVMREPIAPGTVVKIGAEVIAPARELRRLVEPGTIVVEVTAPKAPPVRKTIVGMAGATASVEVPAASAIPAAPAASAGMPGVAGRVGAGGAAGAERPPDMSTVSELSSGSEASRRSRGHVIVAGTIGAAGLVSFAVAGWAAYTGRQHYRDVVAREQSAGRCDAMLACDKPGSAAVAAARDSIKFDVATALTIAGVASAGVATIVYLRAPRERVVLSASATTSSVGMVVSGTF